jgi:hypothetical protein
MQSDWSAVGDRFENTLDRVLQNNAPQATSCVAISEA